MALGKEIEALGPSFDHDTDYPLHRHHPGYMHIEYPALDKTRSINILKEMSLSSLNM